MALFQSSSRRSGGCQERDTTTGTHPQLRALTWREGQRDSLSRLMIGTTGVTIWVIEVISYAYTY